MELVILWIMFAGLTAFIASQKGRSVAAWGLIGLVFGIFGVIAAAMANKVDN